MIGKLIFLAEASVVHAAPFYTSAEFWITNILGAVGVVFAILAYFEAGKAKTAALAAGRSVKLQTVVIELSEIVSRLESIDERLDFTYARELLSESSRRLRRQLAPIKTEEDVAPVIDEVFQLLDNATKALKEVRPTFGTLAASSPEQNQSVFFAIEGHFSALASKLAELTGLLEKRTIQPN